MSHTSEAPNSSPHEAAPAPMWYIWFYKAYWPAWWVGTILIVFSWFGIVTPSVGWVGFSLAGIAVLGSYFLPSLAGVKAEDYVLLDSRLLNTKGEAYQEAMDRFNNGALLMYDGVAFGFRPNNEIACAIVADTNGLNDTSARETAAYARSIFDKLVLESEEFATAIDGRILRISIMAGYEHTQELCRVIDDRLDWRR